MNLEVIKEFFPILIWILFCLSCFQKKLSTNICQKVNMWSHTFTFVGSNASFKELGLRSSSYYYILCNATKDMNASALQDFYRDTLLDPNVLDISAGIAFASAKDTTYSNIIMPGKSTPIIFSEANSEDFLELLDEENKISILSKGHKKHGAKYEKANALVKEKMIRSLILNFPHLDPYIECVDVGNQQSWLTILCE